jgi:hypothetical protein
MIDRLRLAVHDHQPGVGPRGERVLGYKIAWQLVVVLGKLRHGPMCGEACDMVEYRGAGQVA